MTALTLYITEADMETLDLFPGLLLVLMAFFFTFFFEGSDLI